MKEAILTIVKEVSSEVSEWVANDGGLTMNILEQCAIVRNRIENLDLTDFSRWFKRWVGGWDGVMKCSTDLEASLLQGVWWVLNDN